MINNKHVLLPRLVLHAVVITARQHQRIKGKETRKQSAPARREDCLDDAEMTVARGGTSWSLLIIVGSSWKSCPGLEEFAVLTLGGAVPVPTIHRVSEDKKWDTEFMSQVKEAPWDFKASVGADTGDGTTPERIDARPPPPPVEMSLVSK